MTQEDHLAAPSDCCQPPILPLLLPEATVASSSSSPLCSFQMDMDDDAIRLYHNRLLSLFQPPTVSAAPSSSYSATTVHAKLEEDCGSPHPLLRPGSDLHDRLPQQQLHGFPPPPLFPHHCSSFPAALQLCDSTPQLFDEMLSQRPDGESTTATTRASSLSLAAYEYEDDPEASCHTATVPHGESSSVLAALGALQHDHPHHYNSHNTILRDSAVAVADSLFCLDAAALGFICGGVHSPYPPPSTSEEGAATTNGGYMMMDQNGTALEPGFWTDGPDNNDNDAAVWKRLRHLRGHTTEKQRRDQISQKFLALRELLPNSMKPDKSSIVKDAMDYIKELLRIVENLKLLVHGKHLNTLKEPSAQTTAQGGQLRSSWVQRSCPEMCVDVRVLEDEVNIKLCRRPRPHCLLLVARGLLEMQLELLHLTSANIGHNTIIFINAKIQVGSCVHAAVIANKLVDVMSSN